MGIGIGVGVDDDVDNVGDGAEAGVGIGVGAGATRAGVRSLGPANQIDPMPTIRATANASADNRLVFA